MPFSIKTDKGLVDISNKDVEIKIAGASAKVEIISATQFSQASKLKCFVSEDEFEDLDESDFEEVGPGDYLVIKIK